MKVWLTCIGIFVLLVLFGPGCGGGGGGTGGTTGQTYVRYAVEATKNGVLIDPTNIVQGETVKFDIAGYTASNQRVVLSSSGWFTDPTGQGEGTMSGDGTYTATASGNPFTVTGTAAGLGALDAQAQVLPSGQALVTGTLTDGYGDAVYGAKIDFYDGSNTKVGSSISQGDGSFRASVPSTAVTFEINPNGFPSGFYKEYRYTNKKGSTTVTVGANSTIQTVASTANMAVLDNLHFNAEGQDRGVASVQDATHVVLDSSVSSSTGETVLISATKWYLPQGFCRAPLPALSNGASTPLDSSVLIPPTTYNGASLAPPPPPDACS